MGHTKLIHEGTGKLAQTEDLSLFHGLSACAATLPGVMIQTYFAKLHVLIKPWFPHRVFIFNQLIGRRNWHCPFALNMCFDSISAVDQLDEFRNFFFNYRTIGCLSCEKATYQSLFWKYDVSNSINWAQIESKPQWTFLDSCRPFLYKRWPYALNILSTLQT